MNKLIRSFDSPLETTTQPWLKRYSIDTLLATVLALGVTGIIYVLHLYPTIPNISFLYLLIVLGLSSTRGLYAAIIASIVAILSFDFALAEPQHALRIAAPEEWLALFIFLITAITTGRLASALRQRLQQATQYARETRELYDLVNATANEERLECQLYIVACAVVKNFASLGISDCTFLVPNANGELILQADACQPIEQITLSSDERKTAVSVMIEKQVVDFYEDATVSPSPTSALRYTRVVTAKSSTRSHARFQPLLSGQRAVGVMRLLMRQGTRHIPIERNAQLDKERANSQATYFWTFLDQAAALIERANLNRETMQLELLKRTDALRSALLSSVSHDLRTPLSSIKAAASSLLQDDVQWDDETRHSFLLTIEREADRLNRLVSNLLDMSRIEGGALKAEKEWYPISELIHDVLGHLQGLLYGREIQVHLPDDLPPVELDYLQMDQVVTNLLENAARYSLPGSPIEISGKATDDHIIISIADRGPGIPPYDLERIFDKFYRVSGTIRKTSSVMGTGLGLAVCRGLVEAHGGHIWAENRPGGGAIFHFTLPLTKTEGRIR
jgi:two-component system, OmpR family, sensor histidine kinase KdpD